MDSLALKILSKSEFKKATNEAISAKALNNHAPTQQDVIFIND